MNIEGDDTNYADIENIESIEGIIKTSNSGAPSIGDLSPNGDWKCFPQTSYHSCYGLPYQDHNYGAPPLLLHHLVLVKPQPYTPRTKLLKMH
ncbi:hypothetical protein EB796_022827 [Bugula neritina]|uniref:Uncharacterized protein n=1 Tax=Bugula neritina TaxID=10212 RepID=A0A7J7IY88_BUGNE|nr:hypothetical protein EB796_022827 [Bugula neritina]